MISEYIEGLLKNREFFEIVVSKAITYHRDDRYKLRMYDVMSMRLGHTTGKKMIWKDIASQTYNLRLRNNTLSSNRCLQIYNRGLRMCRKAIMELGKSID